MSADTYSRCCAPDDLTTVTLFGDGASAALITGAANDTLAAIGPTVVGSDGTGRDGLLVESGAGRDWSKSVVLSGNPTLKMNGPEVFRFALCEIKPGIQRLLDRTNQDCKDIELFLMHQGNAFLLSHVRKKLGLTEDQMPVDVEETGNTVNASIPILIRRCMERGILYGSKRCVLVGFGVGLSWGMTLLDWNDENHNASAAEC